MNGHTPGPWRVDTEHDDTKIEIVGRPTWGCTRYGVKGEWGIALIDRDDGSDAEANARLIVETPDLLELVRFFASMHSDDIRSYMIDEVQKAQAVLARIDAA